MHGNGTGNRHGKQARATVQHAQRLHEGKLQFLGCTEKGSPRAANGRRQHGSTGGEESRAEQNINFRGSSH